jgi:hypothetical protein
MKATVSYSESGKFQVFTKKELTGVGVKKMNIKSNGEFRYLLTQKAFDKISDNCQWI